MFCRRVPKHLSLFSSNIVIHLSSSLDVCIGVRECTRALCCVVLLSPLQIRIKMNLSVFWVDYKAIGVSCVKYDYVGIE